MAGLDRKHLRLQEIQRLLRFAFKPRHILAGGYVGKHESPQRGQSVEFRDFRPYMPGDDVSHVDWKVYGRTDKLYVRLFEHETELTVTLLVDGSSSMHYERIPGVVTKYDHACRIAAALGFIVVHGQDRVGFGLARGELLDYLPPSNSIGQFTQMLDAMQNRQPTGVAKLARCLQQVAATVKRGETIIVCSDLWEDLDGFFQAAARIRHAGGELIIFHVLHPHELKLPAWSAAELIDSELAVRVQVDLDELRPAYIAKMRERLEMLERRCRQAEIQYQIALLSEPYQRTLERFLERRCS